MRFMTGGETIWTLSARALREADAYWNVELDELPLIGLSEAFARACRFTTEGGLQRCTEDA
jgi:hypothetical protein